MKKKVKYTSIFSFLIVSIKTVNRPKWYNNLNLKTKKKIAQIMKNKTGKTEELMTELGHSRQNVENLVNWWLHEVRLQHL